MSVGGAVAVAAIVGLTLAFRIFQRKETSKPVALTHGAVGATALVLLIIHAAQNPQKLLTVAMTLFVIAALGGVLLFANDLRKNLDRLIRAYAVPLRHPSGAVDGVCIFARAAGRGSLAERNRIGLLERIGEKLGGSLQLDATLRHVTEMLVPLPTLNTSPRTVLSKAAILAATTSRTWTKSRRCAPSPWISRVFFSAARRRKMPSTRA